MNTNLLPIKGAAERLSISQHTLRSWVSQRKIPFIKMGRRVLFDLGDLEKFILSNRVEARQRKGGKNYD